MPRSAESTDPHFRLSDADAAAAIVFQESFLERVNSIPGVSAATSGCPPLGRRCPASQVRGIVGRPPIPQSEWVQVSTPVIEDKYFETVGAHLLEGRAFSRSDSRNAPQVLILNETAARELFPNETALGQRLALGHSVMPDGETAEVVGVVSDILYASPDVGMRPTVYLSRRQVPEENPTFLVRTAADPYSVVSAIRGELRSLDPNMPIHSISTVEALAAQSTGTTRLVSGVLAVFALFATLLAVLGANAVIAYAVSRRSREIGIRVALGAQPTGVLQLVLRQGAAAAAVGIVVGVGAAWGLTRLLSTLLFEVSAADPASFGLAAGVLFVTTLIASYLPARRVTRIDPIEVLRTE
jgi:predicted permease